MFHLPNYLKRLLFTFVYICIRHSARCHLPFVITCSLNRTRFKSVITVVAHEGFEIEIIVVHGFCYVNNAVGMQNETQNINLQ